MGGRPVVRRDGPGAPLSGWNAAPPWITPGAPSWSRPRQNGVAPSPKGLISQQPSPWLAACTEGVSQGRQA